MNCMINESAKKQIRTIWDNYTQSNQVVLDTKGKIINNITGQRIIAIKDLKEIISNFINGATNVYEFKTAIDSYNKRNNLWGFTATKGQMFFNQLTKSNELSIDKLTSILKQTITEPKDINEALSKIETLEGFAASFFTKAKDKRKAPNPGSTGYFLSYFWQIHNYEKWPIIYTSLTKSFRELNLWIDQPSQRADYEFFYNLNDEIKGILKEHTNKEITNWDAENAFWNYTGNPNIITKKEKPLVKVVAEITEVVAHKTNFEITDYLIPKVAKLVELGSETEKSASAKGSQFEKLVAEIFRQLDFEVDFHGQGSGREPDAIIKFREENTAFIVDAKAYSNGYTLGTDDRAIKEYVNHHIPKLQKEGYKKIGFIIVSNSFKSNFDGFINDITWNTDIKRFILLTSEALLYLLAYKTKDKLNLSSIIESLVTFGNVVTAQNIIEEFDDV